MVYWFIEKESNDIFFVGLDYRDIFAIVQAKKAKYFFFIEWARHKVPFVVICLIVNGKKTKEMILAIFS